jgi:probable F420-dependent oxidoreductase
VRFGISFANVGPFARPDAAAAFAVAAEAAGFESLWTVEHVVVPSGYKSVYPFDASGRMPGDDDAPIPDPLIWLAYVAAATSAIKLATGVLILPQRNPVVLAKELSTLDVMSKGRLLLGVGVGWLEEEFNAVGVPFADRGKRMDDYVAALRSLWADGTASHHGDFTDFTDCLARPRPVAGTVPIHVGGNTAVAARRAGHLGDGFIPAGTPHDLRKLFEIMQTSALENGRDHQTIELTAIGEPKPDITHIEQLQELTELGVSRYTVPSTLFWRDTTDALLRFQDQVIGPVGDRG